MAIFTFTASVATAGGTFNGDYMWTNASNWVGGILPSGTPVVSFLTAGSYTVALDSSSLGGSSFGISGLNLLGSGVTLLLSGVTLTDNTGGAVNFQTAAGTIIDLTSGGGLALTGSLSGARIALAGTLEGSGIVKGGIYANGTAGTVLASGGTLELVTAMPTGQGTTYKIDSTTGSVLQLDATIATGTTFTFLGGSQELAIGSGASGGNPALTMAGFATGTSLTNADYIDLLSQNGITVTTYNVASSTQATATLSDGITLTLNGTGYAPGSSTVTATSDGNGGTAVFVDTPCFVTGTLIETARGDVAVERLAVGDMVVVRDGDGTALRPITWLGHRRLDLSAHPRPELAAPVRIRRDAVAPGQPRRDLLLSPDHCLYLDGRLIPAKLLLNGMTIVPDHSLRVVTYYHVELERHGILCSEGLPTESYLDTGNRAFFANAGVATVLHPDFQVNAAAKCWETDGYAPLAVSGASVDAVWQRLARRAEELGIPACAPETTDDPDVCLAVGGRTIPPVAVDGSRFTFVVPEASGAVRLLSRSAIPSEGNRFADDWRRLGVAVSRIVLRRGADRIDIPADHPGLTSGWHPAETDGRTIWRWTDGGAVLFTGDNHRSLVIEVHLGGATTYRVGEEAGWRRAA